MNVRDGFLPLTSKILGVVVMFLLWGIALFGIGVIGTGIGPGIIKLFHALIVGFCVLENLRKCL